MEEGEDNGVLHRPTTKARSYSTTASSVVAVVLYLTSVVLTCIVFGLFVHLYSSRDSTSVGSLFNLTESLTYDVAVMGSSILLFLEILLVILGTASTVLGRRYVSTFVYKLQNNPA